MLNFVLCDDNVNLINKLKDFLNSIFESNNIDALVSYYCTNSNNLLEYSSNHNFDVLMLDVNLKSDINGIDLANKIRKINKNCYIIFTTGHLEYSLLAYKVKTFDFLPKPITYERLEETILRLINDINESPKKYLKIDNKNTMIDESKIYFIKRDKMKIVFQLENTEYDTYSSFKKIESLLPNNFIRCHKSYIVNINNIINFEPVSNTIYFNNSQCKIGPKYKKKLMEVLSNEFANR